ncbi:ABC transporter substrate-binding protein [Mycetocola sp. JXN-3]|uniref:ABC transporter substrate-binding protein n=1 Tax=Mycetocola sp. JXN-3 TaxID=2116510 RepID=UPI00165D1540|nr:sugar ABC transporter substrate-binding protein [Mycetocola sp. JXN-3]
MKKRSLSLLAATAIVALLAGCSGGASAEEDKGLGTADKPVTIKFWHPTQYAPQIVEAFEKSHPNIKVKLTVVPSNQPDIAAKLIAAVQAGDAPDVIKAEYQMLPYLVSQGAVAPLENLKIDEGDYRESVRGLVHFGDKDYGAPEDFTPMMFFYRADLFDQLGLTVPTTWDEYEALARKVKEVAPDKVLGNYNYDSNDLAGWSAQAGADWWKADGEKWTVGIDDPATLKAANFRSKLIKEGLISTETGPGVNNMLADGTILSWNAGAWAPGTIMNANPQLDGKWRAAPMPVWDKGDTETAVSGGSAIILVKNTKVRQAAETFIEWFTDSEEGILTRWKYSNNLSGSDRLDNSKEILEMRPSPIDPAQDYLKLVASQKAKTFSNWGPNALLMQSTWKDIAPKAIAGELSMDDAIKKLQSTVVDDMKRTGFTVTD